MPHLKEEYSTGYYSADPNGNGFCDFIVYSFQGW